MASQTALRSQLPEDPVHHDILMTTEGSPTPTPYQTRVNTPECETCQIKDNTIMSGNEIVEALKKERLSFEKATDGNRYLEAPVQNSTAIASTTSVSTQSKYRWLFAYFLVTLSLTVCNKLILTKLPFPYLLTSAHALAGCIGSILLMQFGVFTPRELTFKEAIVVFTFSLLYTLNIASSNVSLALVSIPFHQVIRALTPVFVVLINVQLLGFSYSHLTYLTLIPTILGVALATYGDYEYTTLGLNLTLLGTFLAALKTVATNYIQTSNFLRLSSYEILFFLSPLAFVESSLTAWSNGEVSTFLTNSFPTLDPLHALSIIFNAGLAFSLNIISFEANRRTGALTMTVAANVKQILTVALGILFFNFTLGFGNVLGIALTLLGGAWYARVELRNGSPRRRPLLTGAPGILAGHNV